MKSTAPYGVCNKLLLKPVCPREWPKLDAPPACSQWSSLCLIQPLCLCSVCYGTLTVLVAGSCCPVLFSVGAVAWKTWCPRECRRRGSRNLEYPFDSYFAFSFVFSCFQEVCLETNVIFDIFGAGLLIKCMSPNKALTHMALFEELESANLLMDPLKF